MPLVWSNVCAYDHVWSTFFRAIVSLFAFIYWENAMNGTVLLYSRGLLVTGDTMKGVDKCQVLAHA